MKRFFEAAFIVALMSIPALAASNSQTVTFADSVKVGATELPAGDYKVSWTGTGSSVEVTIARKGAVTVTLQAKLVEQKHERSGVTTDSHSGANILQVIQLRQVSLVVEGPQAAGQ